MKKYIVLFIITLSILFASCTKDDLIVIGTNAEFPPFEYYHEGELYGFDIDFMRAIAKRANLNISFYDMAFDGLMPALSSKKVDIIIAGLTETKDRKKSVDFSIPYYTSHQVLMVNKNNNDIKSFDDLKNKKVGVVLGFSGELIAKTIPNIKLSEFENSYSLIATLEAKKLDVIILDYETAKNYSNGNNNIKLLHEVYKKEKYSIAFRKKDKKLMTKINLAIKTFINSPDYKKLLIKYSL